jgi:CheY-like chemotaxis protein
MEAEMARILVVEDETLNVEILSRLLKRNGHDVAVAGSRNGAISAMEETPPDLVLMDIGIPDEDGGIMNNAGGLEATRRIKADPRTQHVPIIAISAFAMLDERKRFLDAGCNDVQPKPLDFAALLESIGRHLKPATG